MSWPNLHKKKRPTETHHTHVSTTWPDRYASHSAQSSNPLALWASQHKARTTPLTIFPWIRRLCSSLSLTALPRLFSSLIWSLGVHVLFSFPVVCRTRAPPGKAPPRPAPGPAPELAASVTATRRARPIPRSAMTSQMPLADRLAWFKAITGTLTGRGGYHPQLFSEGGEKTTGDSTQKERTYFAHLGWIFCEKFGLRSSDQIVR